MELYQILLLSLGGALLLAFALWLFLIAPRVRRKRALRPFLRPYAHRGLWGEGVPENSLEAFRLAAEQGFAIELDIQLSSDGEVMVFHDYTLTRMCGNDAHLSALSAARLAECHLNGTDQTVPTLRQVLDTVGGRVPLLIELKGESFSTALVPAALAVLADYAGEWCMESFNPLLLRAVKKQAPHVVRGLLVTDLLRDKKEGSKARNFLLSAMLLNLLARPDFIAWNEKYPHSVSRFVACRWFGAGSLCYTVRDPARYRAHVEKKTYPIFEGFRPEA